MQIKQQLLKYTINGLSISKNDTINCHQDFVIWHCWTAFFRVYKKLKNEIIPIIGEIEKQVCHNFTENFNQSVYIYIVIKAGYWSDTVFRIYF